MYKVMATLVWTSTAHDSSTRHSWHRIDTVLCSIV